MLALLFQGEKGLRRETYAASASSERRPADERGANSEHGRIRSVVSGGVAATRTGVRENNARGGAVKAGGVERRSASEKRVDLRWPGSGKEPMGGGTKSDDANAITGFQFPTVSRCF
jgi:hypothetical protein